MTQKKRGPVEISHEEIFAEVVRNRPGVAKAYAELAPEFELVNQLIALRNKRKMTQGDLAKQVGTQQPSIARLENGHVGSLAFLQRIANALDATVKITLVAKESGGSPRGKRAVQTPRTRARTEPSSLRNSM